ncbi:MAG: hypothetical protein HOP10_07215 [Chitinophagaceae bacterium]|nr:hypothetical protein [Chitinophagaceae bacterium]
MMQEFLITLRNDKTRLYNRISWFIIIINCALLLYLAISSSEKDIRSGSIATLITLAIVLGFYLYFRKTKYRFGFHPFFLFLMLGWIKNEYYWLAGAALVFDLLHLTATTKQVISITKEGIIYPSIFKKKTEWEKLNNLLLKDGLVTIDFKNNKIIQQTIDESKTSVNEREFNEFCRQQLNK